MIKLFGSNEDRDFVMRWKRLRACETREEIIDCFANMGTPEFAAIATELQNNPGRDALHVRDKLLPLLEAVAFQGKGLLFWLLNK
jgi:hypothetical protein